MTRTSSIKIKTSILLSLIALSLNISCSYYVVFAANLDYACKPAEYNMENCPEEIESVCALSLSPEG